MGENENVLSKRLNKVLETRLEDDVETLDALKELSTFYIGNTLQARRNLRSQIEKRSLEINQGFLGTFKTVKENFEIVYNDLLAMNHSLEDMTVRLKNAKSQTSHLLQQTSTFQEQRKKAEIRQNIVTSLIKQFQLSPDDLVTLHGSKNKSDSQITADIFEVLDKVQSIHNDCKILLQSGCQTLALDIMEQMTLHQEGALERLYRWTQRHCRYIDNPEFTYILTHAMSKLQARPILFKYVMDEYCTSRRAILVGEFIDALTVGGPSGNPAPIEMRAHDPQVYVTDILVWLNKVIPVEKQNLELLLKLCDSRDWDTLSETTLSNICEGICQPLKMRIEKILTISQTASALYSITNLIRYYKKSIGKTSKGGLLASTFSDTLQKSEDVYVLVLEQNVNNALVRVETPPRDLSPTPSVIHLIALLRDMLSTANMSEGRELDMGKIAGCIVEPLLRAVNEQASRLPPTDMAVYLLNCMYSMYCCLSMYEFMDERLERLQAQSDAQIDTLTSEQASALVANLSLGPIYTILQDHTHTHGPLSTIPGMEPTNLKTFLTKLNMLANTKDALLLPQMHFIVSSQHKNIIQKRSFDVLLVIYKQLYEGVHNPANGYEDPETILSNKPDELAEILFK